MSDLEKSIITTQDAVKTCPLYRFPRVHFLNNPGIYFLTSFQFLGALDDVQKAISATEESLAKTPRNHPARVGMISNFSAFSAATFTRLGARDDLGRAIRAREEAALDDPNRSREMDTLAVNLLTRFDLNGDLVSLERAILVGENSLVAIPLDHPRIFLPLHNQSSCYKPRFMLCGTLTDLENSIQLAEKAVATTPPDGLDYAGVLIHLASVLLGRRGDQIPCHQRPLNISQKAWNSQMSSPQHRVVVAQLAASILANDLRWKETSDLLSDAVGMLPKISPQFLGRDDQQHLLARYQFSASAIAYAVQAGSPAAHCLTLLEVGRGMIMGFAINCRNDLSELRLKHPKIFD